MNRFCAQVNELWNAPRLKRFHPALCFFFVWTLLPNLAFLSIWVTGGPIRTATIMLYLLVGLAAMRLPLVFVAVLYLLVLTLDVLSLVSGIFNMPITFLVYAVQYVTAIRPFESLTYLTFFALLFASSIAIFWFAKRLRPQWRSVSLSGACLGVVVIMVADVAINLTPEYRWGRVFRAAAPFDSAMQNSGLAQQDLVGNRRDLFIVMIESWGQFADPSHRELVLDPLMREEIESRYSISSGLSDYYGSTTSAEIRELCGRWAEFRDYTETPAPDCLPARLRASGYATTSFHGFTGKMFDRRLWYPNIGFEDSLFRENLENANLRVCGGVFAGLCDIDLSGLVERALVEADGRPRLVYWLTLNSHLPVDPAIGIRFLDCNGRGDPFAQRQVCYLADQWMQVLDKIAGILTNADLHPIDVLIIGDHAPPFWTREAKSFFVRGKVPWVLLRSRDTVGGIATRSIPETSPGITTY